MAKAVLAIVAALSLLAGGAWAGFHMMPSKAFKCGADPSCPAGCSIECPLDCDECPFCP